jgi:hypothetical protein
MVRKSLYKSKGKFRLALIRADCAPQATQRRIQVSLKLGNLQVTQYPALFLMYRGNITQELGGVPLKHEMKEFLKTVLFFYQVANEELLADSLIKEGQRCLTEGKLNDA